MFREINSQKFPKIHSKTTTKIPISSFLSDSIAKSCFFYISVPPSAPVNFTWNCSRVSHNYFSTCSSDMNQRFVFYKFTMTTVGAKRRATKQQQTAKYSTATTYILFSTAIQQQPRMVLLLWTLRSWSNQLQNMNII